MSKLTRKKLQDSEINVGDLYNDGEYSGKVKSVESDGIVIESQNEDGDVVDITIPVTDDTEPTVEDLEDALMDPEFVSDMIEAASNGENSVMAYNENGDGTVDIQIERPITQEEAQYLNEVGLWVGVEGMNKEGWITVSPRPIADSDDFEQFIGEILFRKKAKCPKTGDWKLESNKLINNGKVVADLTGKSFDEAFKLTKEAVENAEPIADAVYRVYYPQEGADELLHEDFEGSEEEAKAAAEDFAANFDRAKVIIHKISDAELNVGDEYNDGEYSGKVTEITADGIKIESEDENGNKTEITVPIKDSAVHAVSESNINDIFDKGITTVVYDPEETDPADIVLEIEDELALGAAPGESVPELDFNVIDDNTIEVFVV